MRAVVSIVPEQFAEIGFYDLRSHLSTLDAFSVDRKSAAIDGFDLVLRHADGRDKNSAMVGYERDV